MRRSPVWESFSAYILTFAQTEISRQGDWHTEMHWIAFWWRKLQRDGRKSVTIKAKGYRALHINESSLLFENFQRYYFYIIYVNYQTFRANKIARRIISLYYNVIIINYYWLIFKIHFSNWVLHRVTRTNVSFSFSAQFIVPIRSFCFIYIFQFS